MKPRHSFGRNSPRAKLAELERDYHCLVSAINDKDTAVDHANKAASDANHIVDWIWQLHFQGNESALNFLAIRAGINRDRQQEDTVKFPARWFVDAIISLCEEVQICREISNGNKHAVSNPSHPLVDECYVSASSTTSMDSAFQFVTTAETPPSKFHPKVALEDGNKKRMTQIIKRTLEFWKAFFNEFSIQ